MTNDPDVNDEDTFDDECDNNEHDVDQGEATGQVFPLEERRLSYHTRRMTLVTMGLLLVVAAALATRCSRAGGTSSSDLSLSLHNSDPISYYSVLKTDRSGQQVLQMFHVHAYIFAMRQTRPAVYGGACSDAVDWQFEHDRKDFDGDMEDFMAMEQERIAVKKEMVASLGLKDELPFSCPIQSDLDNGRAVILDRHDYKKAQFTQEWVSYMQHHSAFDSYFNNLEASNDQEMLQVAVHLRRGEYNPCDLPRKYLPNSYYIQVLDAILPAHCGGAGDTRVCNVTIFSENDLPPFENFEVFVQRQYHMDFDSSLPDIWEALIKADVLVMSKSSFSYVPAVLKPRGMVVNPGNGFTSLPGWITVGQDMIDGKETQSMLDNLQSEIDRLVELQCQP